MNEYFLAHHGILGQRWGIRRYQKTDGALTAAGKEHYRQTRGAANTHITRSEKNVSDKIINVHRKHIQRDAGITSKYQNSDGTLSKKGSKRYVTAEPIKGSELYALKRKNRNPITKKTNSDYALSTYDIYKKNGQKVGNYQTYRNDLTKKNELSWITIDEKYRGKGYAQKTLDKIIEDGKNSIYDTIELEAVGRPDARHIYEKAGFKAIEELTTAEDDPVWGGLMLMELKVK